MDIVYDTNKSYLQHYGILGQKWGVRRFQNADGSYTEAGKKRYAAQMKADLKTQREIDSGLNSLKSKRSRKESPFTQRDNDSYFVKAKTGTIYEKLHNDLASAREKYAKSMKIAKDFNSNEKLVEEYQKKAARKYWEEVGDKNDLEQLKNFEDWYLHDDGDQGDHSSFILYCREKGIDYNKLEDDRINARETYIAECEKAVKQLIGDYGDEPVVFTYKSGYRSEQSIARRVAEVLDDIADDELMEQGYYIPY